MNSFSVLEGCEKMCHENYHLFVQGNGTEDEMSIGCGENFNTIHYNNHFNFEGKIQEHPNDVAVVQDLLIILQCMTSAIQQNEIPGIFLQIKSTTYMHQNNFHFLPTYIRHLSFATKFLMSLNKHVPTTF